MDTSALHLLAGSPGCVICDNNDSNPRSLKLKIYWNPEDKTVHIPCVPDDTWCGYSRIVHGGIIASVLDEAMAWVVKEVTGDWAFTADCSLRYKAALIPDKRYEAVAEVEKVGSRTISVQARFQDEEGKPAALAKAVFIPARGRAAPRA